MEQNKTWTHFLLIGISIMLLSCGSKIIDQINTVSYTYKNNTTVDLNMEVYSIKGDLIREFSIPTDNEVTTDTTHYETPALFAFASHVDMIGDSVVVRFTDNNCLYYLKGENDELFDLTAYDNFNSEELVRQDFYNLYFTFEEEDYEGAESCE